MKGDAKEVSSTDHTRLGGPCIFLPHHWKTQEFFYKRMMTGLDLYTSEYSCCGQWIGLGG